MINKLSIKYKINKRMLGVPELPKSSSKVFLIN